MREIKFRAWNGEKMYVPYYLGLHEHHSATVYDNSRALEYARPNEFAVLMQYTGLKDKNGKEIYEGDILRYNDGSDSSTHKIFWDDKQARWWDKRLEDGDSNTGYYEFEFVTECTIIGNIYANPELLKQ